MMDCPKRRCAVAGLPDDPLVETLSRVPFKSICRFKCVSKAWRDLIADPLHRRKLPQTLEGFFYGHRRRYGEIRYQDAVGGVRGGCNQWPDYVFIDLMGRSAPLVDPSFSFLTEELPGMEHVRIVHSCNGLLLLRHGPRPYTHTLGYVVCNPATEEWVAVPSSGWSDSIPSQAEDDDNNDGYFGEDTFLIFDPAVSSHFRLLHFKNMFPDEVGVRTYSSETGVWTDRSGDQRRLEEGGESLRLGGFRSISSTMGSAIVNGMLHFIAEHIQTYQELIVAVDSEGKTRKVISLPQSHGCSRSEPAFVGQSQGRLYCITEDIEYNINEDAEDNISEDIEENSLQITIWVLEDYDKEEWVTKHCVSSFQLFGTVQWFAHYDYVVVAIHPDRDLIFISHRGQELISYDMDSKEVNTLGTIIEKYGCTPYVPCFSESSVLSNKL